VRVHPELLDARPVRNQPKGNDLWERRYGEINSWERYLTGQGIHVVKLFLNVSKTEQRERFLSRINEPEKNWKFSAADVRERGFWDDYQAAFSALLRSTSTEWSPWYVIPADHKWFARLAAAAVIVNKLSEIAPEYPKVGVKARSALLAAQVELEAEDSRGGGEALHNGDRAPSANGRRAKGAKPKARTKGRRAHSHT
jgi:hypothetical protein